MAPHHAREARPLVVVPEKACDTSSWAFHYAKLPVS